MSYFFFNDTATTEIYTLSLHDALPISEHDGTEHDVFGKLLRFRFHHQHGVLRTGHDEVELGILHPVGRRRSEEHTSELQSRQYLVCRLLLEKKIQQLLTALTFPSDVVL